MVKHLCVVFVLLVHAVLYGQDVKVTAEINPNAVVDQPLKGTIIVTHEKKLEVDPNSFQLEKKPLKTQFVKEVPIGSLVMSFYEFELPPMPKGLYLLPEVTVKVGGKLYTSVPSSYAVSDTQFKTTAPAAPPSQPSPQPSPAVKGQPVILKLENIVEGDTTLFPGQRIRVGYRYSYNYGVDLSKEQIPLLEGKGFKKIGGKESKEFIQGNLAVLEVTQVLEAEKPGEFKFSGGLIEGRAYERGSMDQKIFNSTLSRSETPPVTLTVLPFPEEGKPASFKGAVGDYQLSVSLQSPSKMNVGDQITLLIKISGTGVIENVPMPDVCCQPGFAGFFRMSDLPPEEKVEGDTKTFTVQMRPLLPSITEIPSVEFSFFNPETKKYQTVKSKPIPITVLPVKAQPAEKAAPEEEWKQKEEVPSQPTPGAIEIEGNYLLTQGDLRNIAFGTWWTLLIIPFGIGALLIEMQMKRYIQDYKRTMRPPTSKDLFKDAMIHPPRSPEFFNSMQKAFLLRLTERGDISSPDIDLDALPEEGLPGKVRTFLHKIETLRFSGKEQLIEKDVWEEAENLFRELGTGGSSR